MKLKDDMEKLQKELEELMKIVNTKTKVVETEDKKPKAEVPPLVTSSEGMPDLEKFRENLLEIFASKDDLNDLRTRVESLDTLTSDLNKEQEKTNKEVDRINEKLKELEKQLMDKVNCDQYDSLLALINQLRSTGDNKTEAVPIGPIIPSKDINLIKEIANKFGDLETRVNTLAK
jgi:peptidoglycan hydrolase CwlO-like protein